MKEFISKIREILSSVRFWQVVGLAVVVYLGDTGVITPDLVTALSTVLGGSVLIGTVDKIGSRV